MSLESLSTDQRAVLELVLKRGQGYDDVAGALGIDRAAVRQRALDAFDAIGPQTGVAPLQRALITDYLLGQLPSPVAGQVRARLASSEADRDWAAAVATELAPLASGQLPEIPAAGPTGVVGPAGPAPAPAPQPPAQPRSSRRGGAILIAVATAATIAAVAVIAVWVTGGFSGGGAAADGAPPAARQTATTPAGTSGNGKTRVHQVALTAPDGARRPVGIAEVLRQGDTVGVALVATGVPANTSANAYGVWLAGSGGDSHFLGFAPKRVGSSGKLTVTSARLPANARSFHELLVTVETTDHPTSPGRVVLSGSFKVP